MRELVADLFVSLDGFAAGENEAAFFGYGGPDLDRWIRDNLAPPQTLLFGRVTFEILAGFSQGATDEMNRRITSLPKLVFSSTLAEPLAWENAHLVRAPAEKEVAALKRQPGEMLRTVGSVSLVRGLMQAGLVDRLRLMIFPVIVGPGGKERIYDGYQRMGLELRGTQLLDSRLLLAEYRRSDL